MLSMLIPICQWADSNSSKGEDDLHDDVITLIITLL